jgi:hypothetical protein
MDVDDPLFRVWVKTWGQIIDDCRARLRFFQERLNYSASADTGLEYLRKIHRKYLPDVLAEEGSTEGSDSPS